MQQLDEVSRHFAHIISGVKAAGKTIFDVKPEAEAKYIELMSDLIRFLIRHICEQVEDVAACDRPTLRLHAGLL